MPDGHSSFGRPGDAPSGDPPPCAPPTFEARGTTWDSPATPRCGAPNKTTDCGGGRRRGGRGVPGGGVSALSNELRPAPMK
jgi:hypothetical protein